MWILQEYKFFLIIAILSIATIIFLFNNSLNQQDFITFEVELKQKYTSLKSNDNAILPQAIPNIESLFWLKVNKNIYFFDEAASLNNTTVLPVVKDKDLTLSFIVPESSNNISSIGGDNIWIDDINAINPDWPSGDRGFSLDTGGYIAMTFSDDKDATKIYNLLNKGRLIKDTLYIPFQKDLGLSDPTEDGILLFSTPTDISYKNIIGINILENSTPIAYQDNKLFLIEGWDLYRYSLSLQNLWGNNYTPSKGIGVSNDGSFSILSNASGDVYRKSLVSSSPGLLLFSDPQLQLLSLYNDEIYYTSGWSLYKRSLSSINNEINIINSASNYFEIKNGILYYISLNDLYKRDLTSNIDTLIYENVSLWGTNDNNVYYKDNNTIKKEGINPETLNIDSNDFKVNASGLIYKIWDEIYNEEGILEIEGEITSYGDESNLIYVKDWDTHIYNLSNPEWYSFESVIWENLYDITDIENIKILLNNSGINSQTLSIANDISQLELIDSSTADINNIILSGNEFIIDDLTYSFSNGLNGQAVLDNMSIGDIIIFGSTSYTVKESYPFWRVVFDTSDDLGVYVGQKIYKQNYNYEVINPGNFYNIESLLGAWNNLYVRIELKEPSNQAETPNITNIEIYTDTP